MNRIWASASILLVSTFIVNCNKSDSQKAEEKPTGKTIGIYSEYELEKIPSDKTAQELACEESHRFILSEEEGVDSRVKAGAYRVNSSKSMDKDGAEMRIVTKSTLLSSSKNIRRFKLDFLSAEGFGGLEEKKSVRSTCTRTNVSTKNTEGKEEIKSQWYCTNIDDYPRTEYGNLVRNCALENSSLVSEVKSVGNFALANGASVRAYRTVTTTTGDLKCEGRSMGKGQTTQTRVISAQVAPITMDYSMYNKCSISTLNSTIKVVKLVEGGDNELVSYSSDELTDFN